MYSCKSQLKTKRRQLTFAFDAIADVIIVACTGESSRLIGTSSVRVAATIVVIALVHIFSHNILSK